VHSYYVSFAFLPIKIAVIGKNARITFKIDDLWFVFSVCRLEATFKTREIAFCCSSIAIGLSIIMRVTV